MAQGISQEELAHLAKVERSHFGKLERGNNQPSLWVILRIAEALKCPADEFVRETVELLRQPDDLENSEHSGVSL